MRPTRGVPRPHNTVCDRPRPTQTWLRRELRARGSSYKIRTPKGARTVVLFRDATEEELDLPNVLKQEWDNIKNQKVELDSRANKLKRRAKEQTSLERSIAISDEERESLNRVVRMNLEGGGGIHVGY